MNWDEIRSQFLGLRSYAYLNAASQGLLPKRSIDALKLYAEQKVFGSMYWGEWKHYLEETRKQVARLINVSVEEIGFVPSTTWGINIAALSIPWEKGDNIVITDMEFPANVFPWQAIAKKYGVTVKVVKNENGRIVAEKFEDAVDERTKVIAVSWVEFTNGFVNDLEFLSRLAKKYDAFFVVDAIQGLGAVSLDLSKIEVDFLSCGFQKWMLGTGSAFLYINKKTMNRIEIPFGGWLASKTAADFSFREFDPWEDARRIELGTPAFADFMVAKESVSLINEIGISRIEDRNMRIKRYLIEELEKLGVELYTDPDWKSSIVLFGVPRARELYEHLISNGIIVSFRAGGIRVSPHFYNDENDISRLLDALKQFLRNI